MIKLYPHRIGVEPIFDPDKIGHIWVPDMAKERCDQGIIKYIGAGCLDTFEIGQHIIFSGYTGSTIRIEDEIVIIMHEDFIKAILSVDDYPVQGIYHKGKVDIKKLEDDILKLVQTLQFNTKETTEFILRRIAKYTNDLLIPASYEKSMQLMAVAYMRKFGDKINVKSSRDLGNHESFDEKEEVIYDERSR